MRHTAASRGFTLIELLLSIAVVGILLGLGAKYFPYMLADNRTAQAASSIAQSVRSARTRAMECLSEVTMTPLVAVNGKNYTRYSVYCPLKSTDGVLGIQTSLPDNLTVAVSTPPASLIFTSNGMVKGATGNVTVTVTSSKNASVQARVITISPLGQVSQ